MRTFIYRYDSPETGRLVQLKLGHYPGLKLAEARMQVVRMKELQRKGVCPKAQQGRELAAQREEEEKARTMATEPPPGSTMPLATALRLLAHHGTGGR